MRIVEVARGSLAVAAASFALVTLRYGDPTPLGQSLPAWIPGRASWVDGLALVLLVASIGLCIARTAFPCALAISACYAFWLLATIPSIVPNPLSFGGWYPFCEALTALAGAGVIYPLLVSEERGSKLADSSSRAIRVGQILFGVTCIFYGCSHFAYADYTASMVPTWLPAHRGFAHFTGLGHVAAGVGIALGVLPRLAAALEALMMSLFGLLVWVPSFWADPRPRWAAKPEVQWSELVVNIVLVAAALAIVASLRSRPWFFASRRRVPRS